MIENQFCICVLTIAIFVLESIRNILGLICISGISENTRW